VKHPVVELHAQAAADSAEMRTTLLAVSDTVLGAEADSEVGHHLTLSPPHTVAAAAGSGNVCTGGCGSGGEGGRGWGRR
jgi:hypothetical protein